MSDFNIIQAFMVAGLMNKLVFALLLLMSIYSWGLFFAKYKIFKRAYTKLKYINLDEDSMVDYVRNNQDKYAKYFQLLLSHKKKINPKFVQDMGHNTLNSVMHDLEEHIDHFAVISNTAPFVGLFGTVIGVLNSFQSIGVLDSASLSVIAPGIAEALYATALGLFVAVPASVFYNNMKKRLYAYENLQHNTFFRFLYIDTSSERL